MCGFKGKPIVEPLCHFGVVSLFFPDGPVQSTHFRSRNRNLPRPFLPSLGGDLGGLDLSMLRFLGAAYPWFNKCMVCFAHFVAPLREENRAARNKLVVGAGRTIARTLDDMKSLM